MPPIPTGRLKARLAAKERLGLIWLSLGNASIAEIAAMAGPGALVLDLQHGLWERGTLEAAVGLGGGVPVVGRVADGTPTAIAMALDAGCEGVLVPLVESRAQAESAVAAARFPPHGRRSGGGVRPLAMGFGNYLERAADIVVGVMIETAAGVEQADAIASTPGIDLVLIGTGDLGLSYAGRGLGDEAVEAGCRHVQDACARAGIACGIFTGNLAKALERREKGYQLVVLASDVDVMRDAFDGATRVFAENSP